MLFEFAPDENFNFLQAFARQTGARLQGNTLTLPESLGEGSLLAIRLNPDFSLLIHQYVLTEELILRRTAADNSGDRINVLFHSTAWPERPVEHDKFSTESQKGACDVRITSPNIDSEMRFPPDVSVFFTVLTMTRPALQELLKIKKMNGVVAQILVGESGFLFYETMSPAAQKTLEALTSANGQAELSEFRTWIRVQELLSWLFDRLLARETGKPRLVHRADAEQLGRVRAAVLADLAVPPSLPELARRAGMSTSKLTDLFKQVFGESIYTYFQKARMEEAGYLLGRAGYSVSETGHRLGFSNMSHFSRLFEKHHGSKPKRFGMGR